MTGYRELSFDLGALDATAAEEACFESGASSVTFVDAQDDPVLEPAPGEFRLWPRTRVRCLLAQEIEAGVATRRIAGALGIEPAAIHCAQVADRVWEREWLKDFHAMRFGRRLWIRPHHEEVTEAGAVVVDLDPGLAFGTGTHASTALCLEWLDANLVPGERVIDYGCGSGVLALAAARLGAGAVHAFDIDPQALTATAQNARANHIEALIHVHEACEQLPRDCDVLLANILSGALCALVPAFAALLRPGGRIVLAGIMDAQAQEVTAAYAPCFDVARFGGRDGWICLAGRRHS
jgi:ribosomal protein L11 methyltransferase